MIQILLITVAAALGQTDAAAPPADDLTRQVQTLVRQLDADERLKRDEAQSQLVRLGPALVDLLPSLIADAKSADVKHRLEQIQSQLQLDQAQGFAKARTVTLHGASLPLADVLAAIERQTGNKLVDHREKFGQDVTNPSLKVDFDNTPFWQAVDEVLDQAQLTIYHYAGRDSLAIVARAEAESPRANRATYAGPFRLSATKIEAERDLGRPKHHTLHVQMEVAWEPRFMPINLNQSLGQIAAVDNLSQPLAVENPNSETEIPVQAGQTAVEFSLPFVSPPRTATKIASLKGKLTAVVPSKVETFQFDDVMNKKNVELRKAGATVILEQARKNRDVWEVRMRIRFDEAFGSLESHRGWIYENEAYLVGPDKQRIDHGGFEKTRQAKDEVGVAYLFTLPEGAASYSFVYRTPAAILRLPVEYQLQDLELP